MRERGIDPGAAVVDVPMDRDDGWTVGSPKAIRGCKRMAFALSLWLVGGIGSVAVDLLLIPALFGSVVTGRAALLYLAWFCTGCVILLGALLAGLQRANVHTGNEMIDTKGACDDLS